MNKICDKIYQLRKEHDLSQIELGWRIGRSVHTIYRAENDWKAITLQTVIKLARYFKVNPEWLLGFSEEKELKR